MVQRTVRSQTATTEEDGTPNTDSVDCLKMSITQIQVTDKQGKTTRTTSALHKNRRQPVVRKYLKQATKSDFTVSREYVIGSIMHHIDKQQGSKYVVKSYKCCAKYHFHKPPHHIPTHFIIGYWNILMSKRHGARHN